MIAGYGIRFRSYAAETAREWLLSVCVSGISTLHEVVHPHQSPTTLGVECSGTAFNS